MTVPYEAVIGLLLSIGAVRIVDIFVDYQKRRDEGKPRIIEARAPSSHVLTLEIPKDPSPQQKQELLARLSQFGQQEQKAKTSVGAR